MYKIGGRILILVHQFPFRKRSLSFLTVDATIGSQAVSRDGKCYYISWIKLQ